MKTQMIIALVVIPLVATLLAPLPLKDRASLFAQSLFSFAAIFLLFCLVITLAVFIAEQ